MVSQVLQERIEEIKEEDNYDKREITHLIQNLYYRHRKKKEIDVKNKSGKETGSLAINNKQ